LAYVGRGEVNFHAFPAALPIRIGEEAAENFGVEIGLALEIAVKAAVRQARASHDLAYGDIIKAAAIEKPSGVLNNLAFYFSAMTGGIRHAASLFVISEFL
jgi:hypothetical protein